MSEYNRHKFAMEWMHGGGRDPNGRSLDEEIKIGKEDWMERQRVAAGGRIGLQSGQLVQPGPGRQGYNGLYKNRTEAKKIKEAQEMDKVWDRKTKRMRNRKVGSGGSETRFYYKKHPGETGVSLSEYNKYVEHYTGDKKLKWKDLEGPEHFNLRERVRKQIEAHKKFIDPKESKISQSVKWLTKPQQAKVKKYFKGADFDKWPRGFPTNTKGYRDVTNFMGRGYVWRSFEALPKSSIKDLKDIFGKQIDELGLKWDFDNYKYGIDLSKKGGNEALGKRMIRRLEDPKAWRFAFDFSTPDGWMGAQMDRAARKGLRNADGVLLYEEILNPKGKIVGFTDNTKWGQGKRYFYNKDYVGKGDKLLSKHVDFKETAKFFDIAQRAGGKPNEVIVDLLTKGGIEVDNKLTLNHVLNYLSNAKGVEKTKRAVVLHHKAGLTHATGDFQLLSKIVNQQIKGIEKQVRATGKITADQIAKLDNLGGSIRVGNKVYGGGKRTAIGGYKAVEQFAESSIKKWGPTEFNKFRKFIKQNPKLAKEVGVRLNSGIPIDEIMRMPGMKKAMPWIKGEAYFAFADMLNNWTKGQSFWKGLGKGVEMATFGLADFDTDENALIYHAREKGVPENHIKAMVDYLRYKQEEKKLGHLDTSLAILDRNEELGGELTPSHILNPQGDAGWNYGDREMLNEKIAESEQNLENFYNAYYEGENKDPTIGLVTLENMMESLTAEEWNKTAGIKGIDRGYREMVGAKADEGMVWGPIFGSSMREFFESIGGEETDSLKAFNPQELMSAHPVYGYKEQIKDMESRGISPMEDIRGHFGYAFGDGGRTSYFNGGIASLLKK